MDKRKTQSRSERAFRSLVRSLPMAEAVSLLARMRGCLGRPEPARVWCVVRVTGGCDVLTTGEGAGE